MARQFILAIDQGTTGSTVLVVETTDPKSIKIVGRHTVDFKQYYPKSGWVEHDLEEIWSSVENAAKGAVEQAKKNAGYEHSLLATIGITNQRETLCVFDRESGTPDYNAIVWQCKRSTDICKRLKDAGHEKLFKNRTGLVLDPYFSGTKITWLMENEPEVAEKLKSGKSVLGTIDTFLIHRLTGGKSHVTEASNASRTLAYNIEKGEWDPELIDILGIPNSDCLPEVKNSASDFGVTLGLRFLPNGISINGVLGDQQAALAGQTCFEVGEAKCTYGTGAFLLLNTGKEKLTSNHGLLTTVAWQLGGERTYAFEGASFIAGASVQFLRDQFNMLESAPESEAMAEDSTAAPEVYFVPALAGLGAPYWNPNARGSFMGLTRGTTKNQIARAALEGMAFQVRDLIESMKADFDAPFLVLKVDGGACANSLLMQIQANYLDFPVDRPEDLETTALGAALFAGLGAGLYSDLESLKGVRKTSRVFKPDTNSVAKHLEGWKKAVAAVELFSR
jgi:glycerol kinase